MRGLNLLGLAALAGLCIAVGVPRTEAQLGVEVGVAPVCPYGYYSVAPYNCAPYGYYGPEWFSGGVFIGAGPWFHGPEHFRGHVDNHFEPEHGYKGEYPHRGERAAPEHSAPPRDFRGNEMRDGHGHVVH